VRYHRQKRRRAQGGYTRTRGPVRRMHVQAAAAAAMAPAPVGDNNSSSRSGGDMSSYAVWSENNHTNTTKLESKNDLKSVKVLVNSSYMAKVVK